MSVKELCRQIEDSRTKYAELQTEIRVSGGLLISEILKAEKISLRAFAGRVKRSPTYISQVMNGKSPISEDTLLVIGKKFPSY